jgi:hypothetical protein
MRNGRNHRRMQRQLSVTLLNLLACLLNTEIDFGIRISGYLRVAGGAVSGSSVPVAWGNGFICKLMAQVRVALTGWAALTPFVCGGHGGKCLWGVSVWG